MTKHLALAPASEIPLGEGRTFCIGHTRIAVFRSRDGRVHATQADCPHRGGPLADGLLGGTTLICPLHDWSFDLLTGMALSGSCGIQTYPVTQGRDGTLLLTIEEDGTQPPWRITDYAKFGDR